MCDFPKETNVILLDSSFFTDKSKFDDVNVVKTLDSNNLSENDLYVDGKKHLLVVPDTVKTINKVKELKLKEFEDYIQYKYYKRKIVVLYGNCHMMALFEFLKNNIEFNRKYVIYPIEYIQVIYKDHDKGYFEKPIFKNCDVFIHQAIQVNNRYGKEYASENLISRLKPDCKVIAVPNVYQLPRFFFPQYIKDNEFKTYFPRYNTIFFRDRIIDENIEKGKTLNDIIAIYNDKNLFDKDFIKHEYEKFLDKIRMREKEWDIKVSDFINENISKHLLFFDPNHPTNYFIKYVYSELLTKLGVIDKRLKSEPTLSLETYQMPLCASIIDYFGLDYDLNSHEIRKHGYKIYKCHLNLKKYIIHYFSYIWQDSRFPIIQRIWSFLLHSLFGSFSLIINVISYMKRKVKLFFKK